MKLKTALTCMFLTAICLTNTSCIRGLGTVWTENTEVHRLQRVLTDEAQEQHHLAAAEVTKLVLRTHNGAVTFVGDEDPQAETVVTATKRGGGRTLASAQAALEAIEITVEQKGEGTWQFGWKWRTFKRPSWQATVRFEVHGPGRLDLDAETHNGRITVEGATGDVKVLTHNGRLTLDARDGKLWGRTHNGCIDACYTGPEVSLITHNGSIEADLTNCETVDARIQTHNGSVELEVGEALSVQLTCATHNGRVKCGVEGFSPIKSSKKYLSGMLGAGTGRIDVATHNGSISVHEE